MFPTLKFVTLAKFHDYRTTRNEVNSLQFDREKRNGLKKKWTTHIMFYKDRL